MSFFRFQEYIWLLIYTNDCVYLTKIEKIRSEKLEKYQEGIRIKIWEIINYNDLEKVRKMLKNVGISRYYAKNCRAYARNCRHRKTY